MKRFPLPALMASLFGMVAALVLLAASPAATRASVAWTPPAAYINLPAVVRDAALFATATPTPPSPAWLVLVNEYRAMAQLPPVSEDTYLSRGDWLHARYTVKNDLVSHSEDPNNPWYTPEGLLAAQSSNITSHYRSDASDQYAVDSWMQAPFHAVGILDPRLQRVGYGAYHEEDGGIQMAAALDVLRGRVWNAPSSVVFPVKWPSDDTVVPLARHEGEEPDPLTSCPGYQRPSGLPIILQIGTGYNTPNVTASSLMQGNTALDHCIFDETNYYNPEPSRQDSVRRTLQNRNAIILIPRNPLVLGMRYTVSITVNGRTYTWSFKVSDSARRLSYVDFGPGIRPRSALSGWLDG